MVSSLQRRSFTHFLRPLFFILTTILLKLIVITRSSSNTEVPDYTTLIYKECANQSLSSSDPAKGGLSLSNLYGTLISQSSKSRFYKTTITSQSSTTTITGLFQCRGDQSNVDCYNCVSNLPTLIDKLCPNNPASSRLQLYGCYMTYYPSGTAGSDHDDVVVSGMELLYKSCGESNINGAGFEEKRDTAMYSLQNGMMSGNVVDGFYSTSYESVYATGQCEGDLGNSDCVGCVRSAVQRAQVECGSSISGMVVLNKCFMSYNYYPDGVPKKSASFNSPATSSSSSSSFSSSSSSGSSSGGSGTTNTGKTVAMILGGAALVGFLIICVSFARGAAHRKDGY